METGKTILVLSNTNATNLFELSEQLYLVGAEGGGVSSPLATEPNVEYCGEWRIKPYPKPQ